MYFVFGLGLTASAWAQPVPGDANNDGKITEADLTAIIRQILTNLPVPGNGDINQDGAVDVGDVVVMVNSLDLLKVLPSLDFEVKQAAIAPGQPVGLAWRTTGIKLVADAQLFIRARAPGVILTPTTGRTFSTGLPPGNGPAYYLTPTGWVQGEVSYGTVSGAVNVTLPTSAEGEWEVAAWVREGMNGARQALEVDYVIVSQGPALRLAMNRLAAGPGDVIQARLQLAAGATAQNVDVLAVLTRPDGGMLSLPGLSDMEYFFIENAPSSNESHLLINRPLGDLGLGEYRISARLYASGSRALLGTAHAEFTICDATSLVGGTVTAGGLTPDPAVSDVMAMDLGTGRIAVSAPLLGDGTYSMALPPGRYWLSCAGEGTTGGGDGGIAALADSQRYAFEGKAWKALSVDCSGAPAEVDFFAQVGAAVSDDGQGGVELNSVSVQRALMHLKYEYSGDPNAKAQADALFAQYVASLEQATPGLRIVTDDALTELLDNMAMAQFGVFEEYGGEAEAQQSLVELQGMLNADAVSGLRIEITSSGEASLIVSTNSAHTFENLARTVTLVANVGELAGAVAAASAEQSAGLLEKIEARVPKPIIPILELDLSSSSHPLAPGVFQRRFILKEGDPVSLTIKARLLEGGNDPPTPLPGYPVTLERRRQDGSWAAIDEEPLTTNAQGEVSRTIDIANPLTGVGFLRASFQKEGARQPLTEPWLAYQFDVSPQSVTPQRMLFFQVDKWALKPGETTKGRVYISTHESLGPGGFYHVNLSSTHDAGGQGVFNPTQVTISTTQLAPGSSALGSAEFEFTAPASRGTTTIRGNWTDPPDCPTCPPVIEKTMGIWVDGAGSLSIDAPGGAQGAGLNLAAAQEGVVAGKTGVTAHLRVEGEPLSWAPVSFVLDGLGTLEVAQTQSGPQGQAVTRFVPPIGRSGTASITATAVIEGDTVTDSLSIDFEGRPYYSIAELQGNLPQIAQNARIGMNNDGAVVIGQSIYRVGEAPISFSGMVGYDIDDEGTVYGGVGGFYDEELDCYYAKAAFYGEGAIQIFPGIHGPSGCFFSAWLTGVSASGSYVVGDSGRPWYHPSDPDHNYPQEGVTGTLWAEGAPVLLLPAGKEFSKSDDVNDAGVSVGSAFKNMGSTRSVKWGPGGAFSFLGSPDGGVAVARWVNNHGEVAGVFTRSGLIFPVLWLPASAHGLPAGTHLLPVLPGELASVQDINDEGQIVGYHRGPGGLASFRGWLWMNGETFDLNDLISPDSLYHIYGAFAINENGQIGCGAVLKNDPAKFLVLLLTPEG